MAAAKDAKVVWKEGLAFEGIGGPGFTVSLDTRAEEGGGTGFSPMELLLVSLAGCTAMDVISILNKKRQEVTSFEVHAQAERATEHPRVFTHIVLEFVVTGHQIDRTAVERSVELSATKYCPASAMLGQVVKIEHKITVLEAEAL